jgi:hypothetical protein
MYTLPASLRTTLKEPIGWLATEPELFSLLLDKPYLISVGDQVTYTLLSHGISPRICIVDYLLKRRADEPAMRQTIASYGKTVVQVKNAPATLSDELWEAINDALAHPDRHPVRIEVDGEEDLAALAAIALAPGDATVLYGLPNKGVVVVDATAAHKKKVQGILRAM